MNIHIPYCMLTGPGIWKDLVPIPDITLENVVTKLDGEEEDKREFVRWLGAALQWNSDERPSAKELLFDEWMMKGLNLNRDKQE